MTILFDDFWQRFPRKIAKGAARRMYERATRLAAHEDIMEGLERFVLARPWDGNIKFCPHPATWLFQERWEDEHEAEPLPFGERLTATQALERKLRIVK